MSVLSGKQVELTQTWLVATQAHTSLFATDSPLLPLQDTIHALHFRIYCCISCGILMNNSRTAYKHISETVFIVQGYSALKLITYETETSGCAVDQSQSDENT